MSQTFNVEEVLKIAEQIERNGMAFYQKAAERFGGDEKRTLLRLAEMERTHEKVFANLRRELVAAEEGLEAYDPAGEAQLYLAALADGKIFDLKADPVTLLEPGQSVGEILEIAIDLEKESVVFYLAFKDTVPESLGKDKIDWIIREEMSHIVLLSEMRSSLGA